MSGVMLADLTCRRTDEPTSIAPSVASMARPGGPASSAAPPGRYLSRQLLCAGDTGRRRVVAGEGPGEADRGGCARGKSAVVRRVADGYRFTRLGVVAVP